MPGVTEGAGQGHSPVGHAVGSCQHPLWVHKDTPAQVGAIFTQRNHVRAGVGGSLVPPNDVGLKCVTSWGEGQTARLGWGAPPPP